LKIGKEEVLHIAKLARINLDESEIETFSRQLSNILENFEILDKVDTGNVPPTTQPNPQYTIIKEDKVQPSLERKDVLANAPGKEGEFFKILPVMEK